MRTSSTTGSSRRSVVPVVLGLLLAVGASTPAFADSARSEQWHLDAMKAEEMWKTSTGEGVTVAVIDSGVDATNPDLTGRVLEGLNLEKDLPGDELEDYSGHGTGMAGLISGTGRALGGNGAFGLAPGAKILPIRMPKAGGAANQAAGDKRFNENLPKAIKYAVDHDAKVINVSLGVTTGSQNLNEAVAYALTRGALIFASAGNSGDGSNLVEYPAGTPGVVGVGAVGQDLQRTDESQYGPQVDLSAPGEEMIHACGGETGFCESHGTSDATALASASAALIWSKHPDWTNNQVLRVLLNTAGGPTTGEERADDIGYGIVRPRIALTTPGDPGPADEYPLPDLAAAASPAPSAEPSKAAAGAETGDEPAAAAPAADEEGGNAALWVGLGIGAVVVIGVVAAIIRARRRTAPPAAPTATPYAYQPPQPPHPAYGPPQGPNGPYGGPPQGPGA
ncbi:type VII secretion-associated serine protease mycosin [Streptomyces sp. NBC_00059]|uniref:type VII secretion-associated serine protease mycosin n=1 Tax=Streptomyces sp. NBC_00059 TaxID=2975635 RepID=UPI00225045C1|nr:type VII secretion-associated serine protease mycosin [Streptomyces sp. NBC_00059]MCX5412223.1 type VII secretion-associated serine protease mycosin [Streptomyces sp. NBC_00059]